MRYAPDQKEKTRAKILDAAGKVFRRKGYHPAGVDDVMDEAGLTAGGFYAHFGSKQALLAEAIAHTGVATRRRHAAALANLSGPEWLAAFLRHYLSASHRRGIEEGCPLAALVSEVARADEKVKRSFEGIVRELECQLASHARECEAGATGDRALAALALCVGGLGLARSVQDEALAERILASCRKQAERILCGGPNVRGRASPRRGRKES